MQNSYPEIYVQFLASTILTILLLGTIVTIMFQYKKRRILNEKKMELMQVEYEKRILKTQIEVQEEVLKQISLEIHDNIGQVLLLANINNTILQSMGLPENSNLLIKETKQLLTKAIEDITFFSRSLHSQRVVEIGVFRLMRQDIEQLAAKGLYKIIVEEDDFPNRNVLISNDIQLCVYRMFQEILKNIFKHSKASEIQLSISSQNQHSLCKICDNGIGYTHDPNGFSENQGLGLRGLYERTQLIGGKIEIESKLNIGTCISIIIPHIPNTQLSDAV